MSDDDIGVMRVAPSRGGARPRSDAPPAPAEATPFPRPAPAAPSRPSWRTRVADVLDRYGVVQAALRARGTVRLPLLTVLTYHRVTDRQVASDFDPEVVDATTSEFEEQVKTLVGAFSIVGVDEVTAHFVRGRPLPRNPALITFDDGYRDCYEHALPILERHGARAAFFLSTSYLNDRRLFWWDRISYLVKRSEREVAEISYPRAITLELKRDPQGSLRSLLRVVKDHHGLDLERFLAHVASAVDVDLSPAVERAFVDDLLMTWDEVRALHRAGMDIESHTRTHRILQTLSPADLGAELRDSRRELEEQISAAVRAIAYPVGRSVGDDPLLLAAVRDAGYALGFSNGTGVAVLNEKLNPLDLSRVAVETSVSAAYFRAAIAFPLFAHKKPSQKRRGIIRS